MWGCSWSSDGRFLTLCLRCLLDSSRGHLRLAQHINELCFWERTQPASQHKPLQRYYTDTSGCPGARTEAGFFVFPKLNICSTLGDNVCRSGQRCVAAVVREQQSERSPESTGSEMGCLRRAASNGGRARPTCGCCGDSPTVCWCVFFLGG